MYRIHHSCSFKQTGTSNDEQLNNYELVYQDKEGDWLLAQDVSWR